MLNLDVAHVIPVDVSHKLEVSATACQLTNSEEPPTLVFATTMTNIGGITAVFDNNTGSVFNDKYDWDGWGKVPAQHVGKPILGLRYHYANAFPNEYKKSKALELWYHNGSAWVHHVTLNCKYPATPWPAFEDFDLFSNPMPNPTGQVRIIGRGSWDQYSYRWVSECQLQVLA